MENLNLVNNEFLRQFEIKVDDSLARIEYAEQERKIFLTKISIPEAIQSVEFEENERKEADRITMEKEIDYKCCERFYGNEKLVCDNIRKLGSWLGDYDGLNMKDIVNKLLEDDKQCEDMNPKYQKPMGYLYKTGIVKDIIKKSDGTYYTKKLNNCCLVKDENGEWDYVNKLNTNYNDLSELLTTLFLKGGKIDELTKLNVAEIKSYLLNLRKNNVLLKLFMKYFTIDEYRDFTYNTKGNTVRGDYVEDLTKQMLEKEVIQHYMKVVTVTLLI